MFGTAVYLVDVNGNVISTFPVAGSSVISGPLGRSADAASVSSALSTEDVVILNALLTTTIFTGRIGEVQASPTANTVLDRLKTLATLLNGGLPAALGQSTMANSLRVVLPSDQSDVPTKEKRAATATTSSVNDQATNATILALNANRLGATVYNDSTSDLYLKLGTTATTSDYTVKMAPGAYYEVPFGYTGRIDGIWSADASGAARVTELT